MTMAPAPVAAGMISEALHKLSQQIEQLHNRLERPAPEIFRVSALTRTHVRLRVETWYVAATVAAATTLQLQVGTSVVASAVVTPTSGTLAIPLPITLDRAADVQVIGIGAGTLDDSFLIGYPE